MTGPVTAEALVEALARHYREDHAYLRSTADEMARALVAGPLAPFLAALQQVTAERDAETQRANGAVIRAGVLDMARSNLSYHYHQALDAATNDDLPADLTLTLAERVTRYRNRWLAATSELARLRADRHG